MNESIKVLHFVSKMDRGGQETLIMNLFRNIDRDKVTFDFLCTNMEEGDYDEEIAQLGGEIKYLNQDRIKNKLKLVDNIYLLYKYIKSNCLTYDVFHIHTQHAMTAFLSAFVAKRAGIKNVIIHSHNSSTTYHYKLHKPFKVLLNFINIERLACSNSAGKWMFGKSEYKIINNGIILDKYTFNTRKRNNIREELSWNDKIIIGHVGRFNNQKNHDFLIEIFDYMKKFNEKVHLVLVGKGEEEAKIIKKVKDKNIVENVTFLGTRTDVNNLYQGMDLFLFPSLFEGLPIVLVETQANDLACLISDSITSEIDLTYNIHRLSLNNSAEEWAKKALEILDNSYERSDKSIDMQKCGYDIKKTASIIQNFYCNLK